ncbi:jupiter microtubule associated homolog 1 [Anolis sagrei]|uniref:jupiter microtubule associated homolog 1 n=1 Tax=Anolis sagrei TaxID=38937 RepID=UPI00351FBEA1
MTTTTTYKGMDPSGRSSSRVLRPPGGGSNFNLGFDLPKDQQGGRRNKMASSIFGTPEENPPSWARPTEPKPSDTDESSEPLGLQRRNSSDANSGDCVEPKGREGEAPENTEVEIDVASGPSEEKLPPAAPMPSPVAAAPVPSRRNPPGGKSSLVLG